MTSAESQADTWQGRRCRRFFQESGLEKDQPGGGSRQWGGAQCGNCGMSFWEKLEHVYRLKKSSQSQGRRQKWSQERDN